MRQVLNIMKKILNIEDFGAFRNFLLVFNRISTLLPSDFLFLESFLGKNVGFHSPAVKTLMFLEIANVYFVFL